MAFDLDERLRQSNARFVAAMERIVERYNHPFEDDLLVSMETLTYDTPDGPKQWGDVSIKSLKKWRKKIRKHSVRSQEDAGEESDADVVSVRRKFEGIHFQNLNVTDVEMHEKVKVQVDVIVQEDSRRIPKWIAVAPQESSKSLRLASPVQELIGNQAIVCKKKMELGNKCFSSRSLQLHLPGISTSPNPVTVSMHQPLPEVNETCCDSILDFYQSADEECSWSTVTLGDLYPGMVESLMRLMKKHFQSKVFEYIARHYRRKRWRSRKAKLNITVEKRKEFRPLTLKPAHTNKRSSSSSEGIQNLHFRNDVNACDNKCSFNNLSSLVHYSHGDASEMEMDCSDSILECDSTAGKGQNVSEQTVLPTVMARIGETFLVEDPLQTTASLKNSKCNESENWTYKCSSDYLSVTSTDSSGSAAPHLVKENKTRKTDFPSGDPSGLCSSICNFSANGNAFVPVRNSFLGRAPNTFLRNPEMKIPERGISLQRSHSLSFLPVNHSPSKTQKYEDAFEELYHKLCSKEIQKPLVLTKLPSSSRKLEEKVGLMKNNLSGPVRSNVQFDRAFEKVYQKLSGAGIPKLPRLQRASNLTKYQVIQMSETVNALVNSPVRALPAIPRVKRLANIQNDSLSSPVKRLKNIPDRYFAS
ncbi:Holliday junction recognition protein, partial [Eudromia elegans]